MKFEAFDKDGKLMKDWVVYSVGGGKIMDENSSINESKIYEHSTIDEILPWVERRGQTYWEYVQDREGKDIWDFLNEIWKAMQNSVHEGLDADGVLPVRIISQKKGGFLLDQSQRL